MSHRTLKAVRTPLAACLLVALVAPGMAFAETAKEKALEARVVELERQVQLLLSSQQQQQTQIDRERVVSVSFQRDHDGDAWRIGNPTPLLSAVADAFLPFFEWNEPVPDETR